MADEEDQVEGEDANEEEGGDEGDPNVEGDEGEEGGSKKLIIIIAAAILLLGGVGAGLYFTGMLDNLLGGSEQTEEGAEEHDDAHGDDHGAKKSAKKDDGHGGKDDHGDGHGGGGLFLEIPTMIVNLNADDGAPRYLRLTVQLELNSPDDLSSVEAVIPRVVDQFQTYLRELRVQDLRGSAGIYRLQMELLWRVNQAADPIEVKDVLFQEILIQ